MQYSKWAEAEDAIDAHNGKTRLPGADVPMVVKFADAKKRDNAAAQPRSPLDVWNPGLRRQAPDLAELAGAVSICVLLHLELPNTQISARS